MPATPEVRHLSASVAANSRWASELDRSKATLPARAAFNQRFLDEVDPDRKLSHDERAKRAANAKRAYYQRLALASARARQSPCDGGVA